MLVLFHTHVANGSFTIAKSKGDNGHPCLVHLVKEEKSERQLAAAAHCVFFISSMASCEAPPSTKMPVEDGHGLRVQFRS